MDVYPSRRIVWMAILVLGAFWIGFVIWAVAAVSHGPTLRDWPVLIGLAMFSWGLWRAARQLWRPLPVAHLDEEGVDCALGRVPWRNVANVSVAWQWLSAGRGTHPSRRLFLELRDPKESPAPATGRYLSGLPFGSPIDAYGQVRLPLWGSKARVLEDVGQFYSAA